MSRPGVGGVIDLRAVPLLAPLLLAAWLLVPAVDAHNAAAAPEQYARFLSDCSDDWGGHSAVRDGHDLVALDLTERWIADLDAPGFFVMLTVGFGFAEANSQGGPLYDEVDVTGPGGTLKVRLATKDNKVFTAESGNGLRVPDVIVPPRPSLLQNGVQDGSRFLIEFGFSYANAGVDVGSKITAAKVQAYARQDRGDFMPGGYYLLGVSSGGDRECPQSGHQGGGDPGTLYVRTDYTLRGTEAPFVQLSLNTDAVAVSGNQSAFLTLDVKNKLSKQAQGVSVKAAAPADWSATVEPTFATASSLVSKPFNVRVQAPSGVAKNATLRLTVDTDAGGHATRDVPLYWFPAGVSPTIPSTPTAKGSPAPMIILAVLALGIVAALRRP
jgi:hypothetical protein